MKFPVGITKSETLRGEDPQFDVTDMVGPTFTNQGDTIAVINNEDVYPGESWAAPDNIVQRGKFTVGFRPSANPQPADKNRLLVKYTKLLDAMEIPKRQQC